MEVYKDIKGYDGAYQVSNLGNVKSFKRGKEKILKSGVNSVGYLNVTLFKEKKGKSFSVHKLVTMVFLNHIPDGYNIVVDHIDNNKLNNNVINLQLVTNRKNTSKESRGRSKYIGVYYHKKGKKWASNILINSVRCHLGLFKNEYDAHLAYQEKLKSILINY